MSSVEATPHRASAPLDPGTVAVISNRLETIIREMLNTLLRTARSAVLNTARDFSCAILTADNQLVVFAESLPVHVGGIVFEGEALLELQGDDLRPGDAYLNNSPYHGCTHHADHTILVPVFVDGHHLMTICVKAHQADCGNAVPTTYASAARDLYEEGAISMPCVRVQRDYEDIADIIRMCKMRIRVPDQWYGDYLGSIGAARIGERGVIDLCAKYGVETIRTFVEEWFAYSDRRMSAAIGQLPSGSWEATGRHDGVPGAPDGIPVNVRVTVDADDATVAVDLRDNIDCLPFGLNLSRATATAGGLAVLTSLDPTIPINHGSLSRVSVLIRENCILGGAVHPTSTSVATTNLVDRVTNAVRGLMSDVRPDYGQAEAGLGQPSAMAVISGLDERRGGAPYVNQLFLGSVGGPGVSDGDGWLTFVVPAANGLCYRDSVEVIEQKYPVLVYKQELVTDSGGAGQYRGAPGCLVEYGPVGEGPVTVVYTSDGMETPAAGVRGGGPGGRASEMKGDAHGRVSILPNVGVIELHRGERMRSIACGGGGYGPPRERAEDAVADDVEQGIVSIEQATELYGYRARVVER